jgi:hypothetical protein
MDDNEFNMFKEYYQPNKDFDIVIITIKIKKQAGIDVFF